MSSAAEGSVALERVRKRFEDVQAVDGVSVEVAAGEFFSLLGPSGCGKTTSLRMIAGFERPDEGRVLISGVDHTDVPPHRRPVNTVFQSYALFPHLSVAENVAFGLRFRRLSRSEKRRRAEELLELVRLPGYGDRRPHQLSGGQQQRVALARALVLSPAVLLLDEPLGALDAKLRRELQLELKSLQQEVGITFVYVTHDQEEALTMSDRIAVMANGRIEQLGTPRAVYEEPETAFVADFLGVSNLMRASCDGAGRVRVGDLELVAGQGTTAARGEVRVTIRPERVGIEPPGSVGVNRVPARIERFVYLGSTTQVHVALPGGDVVQALLANAGDVEDYDVGDAVRAYFPSEALRVLDGPDPAA
ncbi:MAG TPA: ABC transporter ATP-binding protein [Gaiellaceae bacterium]|nr:ABC transporter ATP-binding protein [Gaiellaceae bacterium]